MIHLAEGWRDYILLDAGNGEKLEKWGGVTVVRPDPQAFWPRSPKADWNSPDMYYHRSKSGGGHWEILGKNVPDQWQIGYKGLKFHIRPTGFKHMGLFPEQAVNWQWLREKLQNPANRPKVLNLFAYTGGATLACLNAGASVTHIDAAKGMNRWAKDNIALSGLDGVHHRIMEDDALKFVLREGRRGSLYDGIIMDPPVFGRGPGGEMWKLEERLFELAEACTRILSQNPKFMLINAYTAGFSPTVYGNILSIATKKFGGKVTVGEIGLGAKSGVVLPCGMYARWESE
ncbi:MAG: class I SAM-dependent methyltransferase [Firmicutes bacterium]|nr:class I SAM-dependent methyltransferase [Bacillota bacterium]